MTREFLGQNLTLDGETFTNLTALWDELSDFGPQQSQAASIHCMRRICGLIDAKNAFWVGTVRMSGEATAIRDRMRGWRVRGINFIDHTYHIRRRPPETAQGGVRSFPLKSADKDYGMTTYNLLETAGRFRAYRLSAGLLVDLDAFRKTEHYQIAYSNLGVTDRIWVVFPVDEEAESTFCFDRFGDQHEFSDAEMELAAAALSGIKWFHRQLLLSHGLAVSDDPLTASEHRVKQELLAGSREADIARKLCLSPGTVHQYATRIYRKFGVKGRAEFMALWLSSRS